MAATSCRPLCGISKKDAAMKTKLLIVTIFLVIDFYSFAQTNVYHHFPTSNAIWREASGGYQCGCCWDNQYAITGDTVIGIYTYHKLYGSGIHYYDDYYTGYCSNNVAFYTHGYGGAFREDSINKRIYLTSGNNSNDTLVYDFNLQNGDSLPISLINNQNLYHNYVSSVDSVFVGNNYRKCFGITGKDFYGNTDSNYVYLIEGIGSTFGLTSLLVPPFEFGSSLLCYMVNGVSVYPDTNYQCTLLSIDEVIPTKVISRIFPNPFSTSTDIYFDRPYKTIEVDVYNTMGKLNEHLENSNCNKIQLDRQALTDGLYFLRVTLDKNIIVTDKVILNK